MTPRIQLFIVMLLGGLLLTGCVSTNTHQAALTEKMALADDLKKSNALLNACENDRKALTAELLNAQALAEDQEKDIGELIKALDENIDDQKVSEAMLSELNDKLLEMKNDADQQEQRIAELFTKVQRSEEQATREKQIYEHLVIELKTLVDSGKAEITRLAGKTKIRLADSVLFDSGKANIIKSGEEVLSKIGQQLLSISDRRVMIEGHTDAVPIGRNLQAVYSSNLELSAARSVAVHQFLRTKIKMAEGNLAVVAYGSYRPIDTNETDDGRRKNRRVVLVLEPLDN